MAGFLDDLLGSSVVSRGLPAAASAAAGGDWGAVANALGREAVGRVEVRSQVAPPVVVDPFADAPPDAPPNPILTLVKPEVRIYDPAGRLVLAVAPYGTPTEHYLPYLVLAAAAFAVGAWAIGAYLLRRVLP